MTLLPTDATAPGPPPPPPLPPPPRPRRPAGPFTVTGFAALQVLGAIAALLLFVLTTISGILVIAWIGIPLLLLLLPLVRALAQGHRRMAAAILGEPVPSPYRPLPEGTFAALRARVADPASWRDLLWLLWAFTGGFALSLMVVVVFLAVVTFPIWFFGAPQVMRLRSAVDRAILSPGHTEQLEQRVQDLAESRAEVVDHSAAELRRIERDLHDGPQARLAALSLGLGLADDVLDTDPANARRLIREARAASSQALAELRDIVRGIHPPVLADRGLPGAVEALTLAMAVPVDLSVDLPQRLPAPLESAIYFTVAEALANAAKHSGASRLGVELWHRQRPGGWVVGGHVTDDGRGGADPRAGTGLAGIAMRLAAFDGTMGLSSPPGGPTVVSWEVPCDRSASSSPRTTPS